MHYFATYWRPVWPKSAMEPRVSNPMRQLSGRSSYRTRKALVEAHKSLQLGACLILVMGVAGSGKTTLARRILRHISAVYLDNNHIADAFSPDRRNGSAYDRLRPGF